MSCWSNYPLLVSVYITNYWTRFGIINRTLLNHARYLFTSSSHYRVNLTHGPVKRCHTRILYLYYMSVYISSDHWWSMDFVPLGTTHPSLTNALDGRLTNTYNCDGLSVEWRFYQWTSVGLSVLSVWVLCWCLRYQQHNVVWTTSRTATLYLLFIL